MKAFPAVDGQRKELLSLLQQEIKSAQNLLQSLQHEYAVLADHHTETLEEITLAKQKKIQELETIGRQREVLLASINRASGKNPGQMSALLEGDKQLLPLWNELMSLAAKCQDQNFVNGSIIECGYRQSRYALDILRGISSQADLYDHSGRTTNSNKTHTIAQA